MSDVDDQRAREEQKAAALESGAGGEDAASKKASSPQASKEEGCVMFRPWSRDAWVFATALCVVIAGSGVIANYTSFWEVTAGGTCSDYLTIYLYEGVCFGTTNGPETCHSWKDLKNIYKSDSASTAVEEYYEPAFGLFTAGYALAGALICLGIIGRRASSNAQSVLQDFMYMGGVAIAGVMIAGVALTRHTFYTNKDLWFTSCDDVVSSPAAGYVLGMAGWILSLLLSLIAIFPTVDFLVRAD